MRPVARVAAYVRVSTDEQKRSGLGLADQRRRVCGMAAAKGWEDPVIFADEGISGTKDTTRRPQLAKLLAAVRAGEVDAIIILSLDRLGRRTRLVLDLVEEFTRHGVSLVSCKESLDTTTPQGQFVLTMFAALAQLERDLIAERTRAALAEHDRRDGEKGGRLPYGYRRTPAGPAIHRGQAHWVREIYRLRELGLSLRAIAERMQERGAPVPRGGARWHHTSVREILANREAYKGGQRGASSLRWPTIL